MNLKAFAKAFGISLLVMLLPLGLLLVTLGQREAGQLSLPRRQPEEVAPLTLLAALQDEQRPAAFCLLKLDGERRQVVLSLLPRELLLEEGGAFSTLEEVWQKYKGERTAEALCNALEVTIDRSLELQRKDFLSLYNSIGAADFTLSKSITDNGGGLLLVGGRQLIDARRTFEVLRTGQLQTAGEILRSLLEQHLGKLSARQAELLFNTAVNSGRNNMSFSDLESRKTALWKEGALTVLFIPVEGQKSTADGSFLMSTHSAQQLREHFQIENYA